MKSRGVRHGSAANPFGTGFGPASPAAPAGQVVTEPARLATEVRIRFGNTVAEAAFAGITGAGLYQFNVLVPDIPDSDVPVVAEIGGVRTQDSAYLAIKK